MSTSRKHDWLVNKIYEQPELIGIPQNDVISKHQEQILLYKGHFLTIPDIIFNSRTNAYMVEVKSADTVTHYNKGMSQLEKIAFWHEYHQLAQPDITLVMPKRNADKIWIDMLSDLKIYKLGDSYR